MISIDFFYYYLFSFTFVGLEQRVEKKTTTRTVVDTILNRLEIEVVRLFSSYFQINIGWIFVDWKHPDKENEYSEIVCST